MLPAQRVVLSEICQFANAFPFSSSQRKASVEEKIVGRAIAFQYDAVMRAAKKAKIGWHDSLCNHLAAGLWEERYRRPVLACYTPTNPFLVYLCSQSEQAMFPRVYARLHKHIGVVETGRSYVPPQARHVMLWQPPATMVRLWPSADRGLHRGQSYMVDAGNMAGYYSYPYDQQDVAMIIGDPIEHGDYALVPDEEHGIFVEGKREYPYVNRFYHLAWNVDEDSDGRVVIEDAWSEDEDIAREIAEAYLNQLRRENEK